MGLGKPQSCVRSPGWQQGAAWGGGTKLGFRSAPLLKGHYSLFCITACIGFSGAVTRVLPNAAFSRQCHPQSTGVTGSSGPLS